jgi:predicted transcriptional regulator
MTTIALKKYLVSKINLLEDSSVLDKIKELIDETSKVYVLSEYQIQRVEESRRQIEAGNFLTQEEMDKKVEEWLNEK